MAEHRIDLSRLGVALDEYVGVPLEEPRCCVNVIRRAVVEPRGVPPGRYFSVGFPEPEKQGSVLQHAQRVERMGELDMIVLDRGQNSLASGLHTSHAAV